MGENDKNYLFDTMDTMDTIPSGKLNEYKNLSKTIPGPSIFSFHLQSLLTKFNTKNTKTQRHKAFKVFSLSL